ncbi:hypothetical protein ACVWWG_005423 [Bradyrhizobium sp. LB7.2]
MLFEEQQRHEATHLRSFQHSDLRWTPLVLMGSATPPRDPDEEDEEDEEDEDDEDGADEPAVVREPDED